MRQCGDQFGRRQDGMREARAVQLVRGMHHFFTEGRRCVLDRGPGLGIYQLHLAQEPALFAQVNRQPIGSTNLD